MNKNEEKGDLFTKVVGNRKQSIVVATNRFDESQLYITVPNLGAAYKASWMLNEFKFKSEHQKALKISEMELIKMREQILTSIRIPEIDEPQTVVEKMIAANLHPAQAIIDQIGLDGEVLAADQLLGPKTVIYFWPPYQIISQHYELILGGKKLFQEISSKTEEEFKDKVPGRFKFNLGNWTNRQKGYFASPVNGIQNDSESTEAEESDKDLMLIAALVESATVPYREEIPIVDDSYFNDSPPVQQD
jgi:hypothetical protein